MLGHNRKSFAGISSFDLHSDPGRWGSYYPYCADNATELSNNLSQVAPGEGVARGLRLHSQPLKPSSGAVRILKAFTESSYVWSEPLA